MTADFTPLREALRYSEVAMRVRVRDIQEAVAERFGVGLIEMSSHRQREHR